MADTTPQATQASPMGWIIIAVIGFLIWQQFSGPSTPDVPNPTPSPVDPLNPEPTSVSEADAWKALADYVAADRFGVLNSHTDHVILIVEELKALGTLKDITRVEQWRGKRTEITAENRASVAALLRGGA